VASKQNSMINTVQLSKKKVQDISRTGETLHRYVDRLNDIHGKERYTLDFCVYTRERGIRVVEAFLRNAKTDRIIFRRSKVITATTEHDETNEGFAISFVASEILLTCFGAGLESIESFNKAQRGGR
jgi:hypothetical protein